MVTKITEEGYYRLDIFRPKMKDESKNIYYNMAELKDDFEKYDKTTKTYTRDKFTHELYYFKIDKTAPKCTKIELDSEKSKHK